MEDNRGLSGTHLHRMAVQTVGWPSVPPSYAALICVQARNELIGGEAGGSPEARAFMAVIKRRADRRASQDECIEAFGAWRDGGLTP